MTTPINVPSSNQNQNGLADTPLMRALAHLAVDPPTDLTDRVFAQWVQVAGPLGAMYVAFTDQGISFVRLAELMDDKPEPFFEAFRDRFGRPIHPAARPPAGLLAALRSGRSRDLAFDLRGQSEFEQAVLRKALEIPRGETRPYSWIAREIGRPGAVRAAGSALGRNPIPILIPCHRVVRSDGEPGNYAFGWRRKRALLAAEDVDLEETRRLAANHVHFLASDTTGVVCYPTCHSARRITPGHRVGFRTAAAAVAAGYRPCQHCRPALGRTA